MKLGRCCLEQLETFCGVCADIYLCGGQSFARCDEVRGIGYTFSVRIRINSLDVKGPLNVDCAQKALPCVCSVALDVKDYELRDSLHGYGHRHAYYFIRVVLCDGCVKQPTF